MKIFITGGTSGIGKAMVQDLSKDHDVFFTGRNTVKGKQVSLETGATFIEVDLSDLQECVRVAKEYFEQFGICDVLVNNAGLWTEGKIEDTDSKEIEDIFAINTLAPVVMTKEFVPYMKRSITSGEQKGARIVFINSVAGLNPKAERSVYNASKWAITGFARSLSLELDEHKIGVTNLSPGYINTELFDNSGYSRDMSGAIGPENVAKALRNVIEFPLDVSISELVVKPTQYS